MNIEMKDGSPKVSIIVTCFNLGKYLDSSVNSALNQTYKNIEVILVDDGSTEQDTKKIISKWKEDGRVKVIQISNGGVANARNVGIAQSKGQYICCLDADDKLDPEYIQKTVEVFQSADEKVGIVTTWVKRFEKENTIWEVKEYNPIEMLWSNSIHIASLFRKDIFEKTGGYDTTMLGYQDWNLWLSFMELGYRYEVVKEPIFLYRVRSNSMITTSDKKRIDIYKYLVKKHKALYVENAPELIIALESKRYLLESFLERARAKKKDLKRRNRLLEMEIATINKNAEKLQKKLEYRRNRSSIRFKNTIRNIYKYPTFIKAYIESSVRRNSFRKESFKTLSLDVFDTLVRRDVYPEEA
jgi:glycosyltransferase involved in cell wall biosynthesis